MANSHLPDSAFWRLICCGCVGVAVLGCPQLIWGVDYSRDLIRQLEDQTRIPGFEESPKSKEELDPETRRKYEIVRRQYAEAEQALKNAKQQAFIDDPLRQKALDLSRQASEKQPVLRPLKNRTDAYFEQLDLKQRRNARRMQAAYEKIQTYEAARRMNEDHSLHQIFLYFSKLFVSEYREPISAALPEEMPDSAEAIAALTEQDSFRILMKYLKSEHDDGAATNAELKNTVTLPDFVRSYEKAAAQRHLMFVANDAYFRMKTPESIPAAKKEMIRIGRELTKIWPRWRWAEVPPELRDRPERFTLPVPQRHTTLWWMIGGNLVFFIALFVFLRLRAIKPMG